MSCSRLRPAFDGDDRQQLAEANRLRRTAAPAETQSPNSGRSWKRSSKKPFAKTPPNRYATAHDLAEDLRSFLANKPIKAKPPGAREKLQLMWSRRHPAGVRATLIAGLAVLIAIAASVGWALRDRAIRQSALDQQISQALEETRDLHQFGKLAEAMSAAQRAEGLFAGGGSEEIRDQIRQWRSDLETVNRLEQIRLDQALINAEQKSPRGGTAQIPVDPDDDRDVESGIGKPRREFDRAAADQAYQMEFKRYGLDLAAPDVAEVARRSSGFGY